MLTKIQSPLLSLTRRADVVVAVLLVAIIFMMILPMPTMLVDTLIAINLGTAAILLMVGVYIPSPTAFSSLPSVLLLSTLFRLALSITTTRLILTQADAGKIVYTFGDFVIAGNLVVGLVVFLIITLVQFIVITKGSERVAEVAARFSLDGMPGKQMSIDSDLRSGVITMAQAREQRSQLQKESQLYGAMDGAMKFVKGDAIAGLLIIIVNILGGVSVGVFQQGMSAADALSLYAVLTVGDGLVSQIPALFIAITSGIIVTRVTTEESENLGADISSQILNQPKALMIGSGISFGFALIPGFPSPIFIGIGIMTGLLGFTLTKLQGQHDEAMLESVPGMDVGMDKLSAPSADAKASVTHAAPLVIEVSDKAKTTLAPEVLNKELARVRMALFQDLGVPYPGVHLRLNAALPDDGYVIQLQDIPVAQGQFGLDRVLVAQGAEELTLMDIPYELGEDFLPGLKSVWVESKHLATLRNNGIEVLAPARILSHHLAYVLRQHARQFVGIQEAHLLLNQMETRYGELVKETLRVVPLNKVADILRRLVAEDISIRDLRSILEALVEWGEQEENPEQLCEYVRTSLKRQISYRFSAGQNILPVYLVDPAIEDTLRNQIRQTPTGSYLALDPAMSQNFIESIRHNISRNPERPGQTALLTSLDLRRHVRKLIEADFHDLPVLSYQELAAEITVQPLGKIGLTPLEHAA